MVNSDGVLRQYSTVDFTVSIAVPLTSAEMTRYAKMDAKAMAKFAGVDGTKVAEENMMHPGDYYVAEAKQAISAGSQPLGQRGILHRAAAWSKCDYRPCLSNKSCKGDGCGNCIYLVEWSLCDYPQCGTSTFMFRKHQHMYQEPP